MVANARGRVTAVVVARARVLLVIGAVFVAMAWVVLDPRAPTWQYATSGRLWDDRSVALSAATAAATAVLLVVTWTAGRRRPVNERVRSLAGLMVVADAVATLVTGAYDGAECMQHACPSAVGGWWWANWIGFYASLAVASLAVLAAARMLAATDLGH